MGLNHRVKLVSHFWRQISHTGKLDSLGTRLPKVQILHQKLSYQHLQSDLTACFSTQQLNERSPTQSSIQLPYIDGPKSRRSIDSVRINLQEDDRMRRVHESLFTGKGWHVHLLFGFRANGNSTEGRAQSSPEKTLCHIFQDHWWEIKTYKKMAADINQSSDRADNQNLRVRQF